MKYSQQIGIVLALLLIGSSFLTWAYIPSINFVATGMNSNRLGYGKPGLLLSFFSIINIAFFIIPNATIKRINLFITGMNFAWALRNFNLYSTCAGGECPVRKFGLYIMLILAVGVFIMSLLPTTKISRNDAFKQ